MKKSLAVVIIILLIGFAISPGIHADIDTSCVSDHNRKSRKLTEEELHKSRYVDIPIRYRYITEDGQIHTVTKSRSEIMAERSQHFEEENLLNIPTKIGNGNHSPIYIEGNNDFTPENGVTGGSGTENDPYIIENWVIIYDGVAENGIFVNNTDVYFIIRNCTVSYFDGNFYSGIFFSNVENGSLEDVETFRNYKGIKLEECKYINIVNSSSHGNHGFYANGIVFYRSEYITMASCVFYDNKGDAAIGIYIYESSHFVIENTSCYLNDWMGLYITHRADHPDYICKYITTKDCEFYKNFCHGICIFSLFVYGESYRVPTYNHIIHCKIYDNGHPWPGTENGHAGLNIEGLYCNNVIEECIVHDNGRGIRIGCSNNIIKNCSVFNNSVTTDVMAEGIIVVGYFLERAMALNNTIINCDIHDNELGIWLLETWKSKVYKNNIYNNNFWGIMMDDLPFAISTGWINYNNFFGNGYEEDWGSSMHTEKAIVDARYNWWDSEDGPRVYWYNLRFNIWFPLTPWRHGEKIFRDKSIQFLRPWATEPFPDAGVK